MTKLKPCTRAELLSFVQAYQSELEDCVTQDTSSNVLHHFIDIDACPERIVAYYEISPDNLERSWHINLEQ